MSFEKLDELNKKLESLDHAMAILGVDEAVSMPSGGGEARAQSMATLAGMRHETATAPHIADWTGAAKEESLSQEQIFALDEFERIYQQNICLPADFVRRQTQTTTQSEQAWRDMRPNNDWAGFEPLLTEVVKLAREEAQMRADATGLAPYDALMEQYDPGNRAADIEPIFGQLKSFLANFLPQALEAQAKREAENPLKSLDGPFPIEHQRQLGLAAMKSIGFDFDHGRLDTSHHPFCGGVRTDVRITTRYDESEFLTSLLAVLHETGHAQYEQGGVQGMDHWPHTHARGMGFHESQSLFVEMQIARSAEFWQFVRPMVAKHIGEAALADFSDADIMAKVNRIEPGFIRVDADEVTYPLHVILRFEMEKALITGQMEVSDIPQAWDANMQASLGLKTLDNPKDGPMQDVHWPAGLFGYFPSYTLGAMMAAQQWAAMEKTIPDARLKIAQGEFEAINTWRKENIWQAGSRYTTPELMRRATGEELNSDYFTAHLKRRYLPE